MPKLPKDRCEAITKDGKRCKKPFAENCNGLCVVHYKAKQELEKKTEPDHKLEIEEMEDVDGSEEVEVEEVESRDDEYINQLINRIVSLELEISTQKQTISKFTTEEEIESKLKKEGTKKVRKYVWTNPRIQQKAKWLYYREHKKDEDILEFIYNKLSPAGVIYNVSVKIDGLIQEKPFIPWQYVKSCCDTKFDQMAPVDKQKFLQQAIEMLG